jgi:hypothetical protein
MTPDDPGSGPEPALDTIQGQALTPDAFARLTALEQSQELLRRAQFLETSSRARHAEAIDRYETMHAAHVRHMGRLLDVLQRQQELQAQLMALQGAMATTQEQQAARQDDHARRLAQHEAVMAQLQTILVGVLELLRNRNGY